MSEPRAYKTSEAKRQRAKEYYLKNREAIRLKQNEYNRAHREKNKDAVRRRSREWRNKNKERVNARCRERWAGNRDFFLKKGAEYREKNRGLLRQNSKIRKRFEVARDRGYKACEHVDEHALREKQGNKCIICGVGLCYGRLSHLDHCHFTGIARGVLCLKCNTAIGMANDNIEILSRAAKYIAENGNIELPSSPLRFEDEESPMPCCRDERMVWDVASETTKQSLMGSP